MPGFWSDFRGALRSLYQQPIFAITVTLTVGMGIGINSLVFGIINGVIFKPLPVENLEKLVNLYTSRPDGSGANPFSLPDFRDLKASETVFDGVFGYGAFLGALTGPQPETVFGEVVTGEYFQTLGLQASAGRLLDERDEPMGAVPTAVISHRLWQSRFGGSAGAVGSQIVLNGRSFSVVGIAPQDFSGLLARGVPIDVWTGFSQVTFFRQQVESRGNRWLHVKALLSPSTSISRAQAFLEGFGERLEEAFPETNERRRFRAIATTDVILHPESDGPILLISTLLLGAVSLLLLVICANLANLFMARTVARIRDYSIRRALGASGAALLLRPTLEALLVSLGGGAIGLGSTVWCSAFLHRFEPPLPFPLRFDLGIDARVVLFSLLLSFLVAGVFGLITAIQVRKASTAVLLREGDWATAGRSQRRWSRFLLVPQLSFSVLILVVAGLFVRSVSLASDVDPGFNTDQTAMAGVELRLAGYEPERAAEFWSRLKQIVEDQPEIARAATTTWIPAGALFGRSTTEISTPSGDQPIQHGRVGLDFFDTLEIPILQGRAFLRTDYQGVGRVAIVSQAAARSLWPNQPVLGRQIRVGGPDAPFYEIVGVARDTKVQTLGEEAEPFLYTPLTEGQNGLVMMVARSRGGNRELVALLQGSIRQLDPNVPVFDTTTFEAHIGVLLYPFQMTARLGAFLGLATLALVAVGLYGLVALSVSQRIRELGIRVALGAQPGNIVRLLLKDVSWLVGGSLLLGLAVAVGVSRLLAGFVFGIQAQDPLTFSIVPVLLAAITLIAASIPLREALETDPAQILRA